jgi:hypothetical protein
LFNLTWPIIWSFISAIVVPVIKIILRALGIGGVVFVGFTVLIDAVKSQFMALMGGLPSDILAILTLLGFFQVVSLFFSALTTRLILSRLEGDRVTVWSSPSPGDIFRA